VPSVVGKSCARTFAPAVLTGAAESPLFGF
jgi:hypothetical protein